MADQLGVRDERTRIASREYAGVQSLREARFDRQKMATAVEAAKRAGVDAREWLWNAREAERTLGRMILAAREAGDLAEHGGDHDGSGPTSGRTRLEDLDVSYDLAAYAVRVAEIPDEEWASWHDSISEPSQIAVDGEARAYLGSDSSGYERRRQQLSSEWYTPAYIAEAARRVLGTIDLDPASSEAANKTIQATRYFTRADDGLLLPWHGNVWLNPPYQGQAGAFVTKLVKSHEAGDVPAAITLISAMTTDTGHFRQLWDHLLCFVYGRIKFDSEGGSGSSNTAGSVLVYLGPERDKFQDEFVQYGAVVERRRR